MHASLLDNQFFQMFVVYAAPLLVTGVLLLLGLFLASRAKWWNEAGKVGRLWDGLRLAEELAGKAVAAALTELQGEYRRLVADGNLSQADVEVLRAKAQLIIKDRLGASGLEFMRRSLSSLGLDAESFLATQVSAAISRLAGQDPSKLQLSGTSAGVGAALAAAAGPALAAGAAAVSKAVAPPTVAQVTATTAPLVRP